MDKWLKKPVAKKRKHGEFSYFSYINYMTIYSHKFLTDCKLSELRIALINTITNHSRGGTHDIFGRGCATIKSLYRPFLEFLTKKLDPFRNFCT